MSERVPAAVEVEILRQEGFDPAASAGLFVGVSTFEDSRFHSVPFAVDDAVDLAHLFSVELGLLEPRRCVLALAGEPRKPETGERLARLLARGAKRSTARQRDFYSHLGEQAREAGPRGLFIVCVASHGVSDQGGDFLVATDSLAGRTLRTGVSVNELVDEVARAHVPRRLVLMDACRERLTAGTRGEAGEEGASMAASFANAMAKAKGQVVLAGATLGGFAYDDVKRGNGVFTGALLDGLRGSASADERGWITARTLAEFVEGRVIEWVERNRPEHAAKSFGILKHFEGPADSLPLAVDPGRSRVQEAYRARRAAALARLKDNLGTILKGAAYDYVEAQLPEREPTPRAMHLLEEVEALDGTEHRTRLLLYVLRELRGELPAPAQPEPSAKETAIQVVVRPPTSSRKPFRWQRMVVSTVVGVSLLLAMASPWLARRWNDEPSSTESRPEDSQQPSGPTSDSVQEGLYRKRLRLPPVSTSSIYRRVGDPRPRLVLNQFLRQFDLYDPLVHVELEVFPVEPQDCEVATPTLSTCLWRFSDVPETIHETGIGVELAVGEFFGLRLRGGDSPAFVTVLDLMSDGAISVLWPPPGFRERFIPSKDGAQFLDEIFRVTEPTGNDVLLLITSAEQIDFSPLSRQGPLELDAGAHEKLGPLAPILDEAFLRGGKPPTLTPTRASVSRRLIRVVRA